ncbi:3-isopropylmalate dehydratase small subunit [Luteitalea sp. TBR-22]|uniref:3-isopropylmalate dehydratase small subunit n=1 Tax=Luteitalea sp. TBR-22 TaxID=2802971 RepID=UPI001AFBEEAE|nr:3-isopropylmalate dehydratase small subunit [Luteitalea sp. TBR-22]BCS30825.1 3-isopropylmalate dehydratase small subunit [Luteitalea sp. TBR-22]
MSAIVRIERVEGRLLPLRGHDIDTDRIIPARFLRVITFEGLEKHAFEDDIASRAAAGDPHPFAQERFAGARILVVNRNFGCGSSREHAPQALQRWGIAAVVGESFSEIFFGNSLAIGLACVTASPEDLEWLQALGEQDPQGSATLDLTTLTLRAGGRDIPVSGPRAAIEAFVTGAWDATGLLLEDQAAVQATAERLPYVSGF